eukprot:TRINITY_DN8309_c2_g1_i2.p2 TRINITY_DN8309_c2_g1~~TRINITY_DN8309_c2_g1_i2.p2  ORF type:complete len:149 (+),score=24.40 TRINITY_DN8309_c2_g1_i2:38-448(+)
MLPLNLLNAAKGAAVLIELKNGETYNGHMITCDTWMNVHLKDVICTSKDGDRFWRMPEAYIRGNTVKYIRVPDEALEKAQEESQKKQVRPQIQGRGRGRGREEGGRGRRGGGRGGRGRGGKQSDVNDQQQSQKQPI